MQADLGGTAQRKCETRLGCGVQKPVTVLHGGGWWFSIPVLIKSYYIHLYECLNSQKPAFYANW